MNQIHRLVLTTKNLQVIRHVYFKFLGVLPLTHLTQTNKYKTKFTLRPWW